MVFRKHLLDAGLVVLAEIGVLVKMGLEPLHLLEVADEGNLGGIPLQIGDVRWCAIETLGGHERSELLGCAA